MGRNTKEEEEKKKEKKISCFEITAVNESIWPDSVHSGVFSAEVFYVEVFTR